MVHGGDRSPARYNGDTARNGLLKLAFLMAKKQTETPVEETVETGPASITTRFQVSAVHDESITGKFQERVTLNPTLGEPLDGSGNPNTSFALSSGEINGVVQLVVTNPDLDGFFESGKQYEIVITEIPPQLPQLT